MIRVVLAAFAGGTLLAASLSGCSPALSRLPVPSGTAADVSLENVPAGPDSMYVYLVQRDGQRHAGMVHDEMRIIRHDGRPALLRVYRTDLGMAGLTVDTMISSLPSLRAFSVSSQGLQPWRFASAADSVTGMRTDASGSRSAIARALHGPVYAASMFDMMVRAAPLADGYRLSVHAYSAPRDSLIPLTATVTGSERVAVENGRSVEAWRVRVDFAGQETIMWIDKETRAMARQTLQLSPYVTMLMSRVPPRG